MIARKTIGLPERARACQSVPGPARATARVARTIHGDVLHGQLGIVRATLAVALAVQSYSYRSFTDPVLLLIIGLHSVFTMCYTLLKKNT